MDTPQVTPALLTGALELLVGSGRPVLGLAQDGGWWALGLPRPVPGAFDGVPMSTDAAGAAQHARLHELGLPPLALPVLRDVDLHLAASLLRRGCPTDIALQILF